ncbi:MAG TPA: RIP metalloprotease RseP [Terriglobia bacterium]|nr:RIP metalloprotease RseP [Terriglobia bacterium]
MSTLSNAATDVVVIVIALGLMVFIHELGHFLAAKWMGVRVLTFSFGFGKRLFGVKRGTFSFGRLEDAESPGTDYRLSLLLLGGYVKMAGEDPSQAHTGDPGEFLARPRWQRFVIVIMGPAMNVVLAVGLLTALYRYHYEEPVFETQAARLGEVVPDSPAAQAGFVPGDLLTRVGEVDNPKWEDVEVQVAMSPGQTLRVDVMRGGQPRQMDLTPRAEGRERLGYAGWAPCLTPELAVVESGSPAARAGLQPGDQIKAYDGRPLLCWQNLTPALQASNGKPAVFTVRRAGRDLNLTVTPAFGTVADQKKWYIGVYPKDSVVKQLPWPKAFTSSVAENIKICELTFAAIGKVLTRQMSARSFAGPIGMAQMSGEAYREGLPDLISVTASISLSLGIFNLLPVPILDGGVIFLLLIESVMRRDLSLQVKERVVQVGLALLLLLTVFVMYNDIVKSFNPN